MSGGAVWYLVEREREGTLSRLADRFWAEVTEERVLAFISNVRDVVVWPSQNIIMELSMTDKSDAKHSDPYPKMPWESGNNAGRHREPGCVHMVLAFLAIVALLIIGLL